MTDPPEEGKPATPDAEKSLWSGPADAASADQSDAQESQDASVDDAHAEPSTAETASNVEDAATMVKVCPKCSVQETTDGLFCPHCGARYAKKQRSKRSKVILLAAVGLLILAAIGVGIAFKVNHDDEVQAKRDKQHRIEVAAAAARAEQAKREAAAAKAASEKRKLDRALRQLMVHEMEKTITKDAKKNVNEGVLDGPILGSQCSPAPGGGSKSAAPYTCMAITKRNGDGTVEGYNFTVTANMNTGSMTWHLGN